MNKDKKIKEKITHGTRREKGRVRTSIWLAHEQCCFIRQKRSFLTCLSFLSSSQFSQAAGGKKREASVSLSLVLTKKEKKNKWGGAKKAISAYGGLGKIQFFGFTGPSSRTAAVTEGLRPSGSHRQENPCQRSRGTLALGRVSQASPRGGRSATAGSQV